MFRFEGKGIHVGPKTSTQLYYMGKHYNFFVQLMNVGCLVQKRWSPVRWLKSKLSFGTGQKIIPNTIMSYMKHKSIFF